MYNDSFKLLVLNKVIDIIRSGFMDAVSRQEVPLTVATPVHSLGLDSLDLVEFTLEVERQFEIDIDDALMGENFISPSEFTLGDFVNKILELEPKLNLGVVGTEDPSDVMDTKPFKDRLRYGLNEARALYMEVNGGDNKDLITPYDRLILEMESEVQ